MNLNILSGFFIPCVCACTSASRRNRHVLNVSRLEQLAPVAHWIGAGH